MATPLGSPRRTVVSSAARRCWASHRRIAIWCKSSCVALADREFAARVWSRRRESPFERSLAMRRAIDGSSPSVSPRARASPSARSTCPRSTSPPSLAESSMARPASTVTFATQYAASTPSTATCVWACVFLRKRGPPHLAGGVSEQLQRLIGVSGCILVEKKKQPHPLYVLRFGKYASITLLSWLHRDSSEPRLERQFLIWRRYVRAQSNGRFAYRRASTHVRVQASLDRAEAEHYT